jgi:alpha-beta hydrolase superfamily lysophospholipase
MTFAGDGVLLAGQIEYPATPLPAGGFPLVFVLHHAGCNTRDCYNPLAQTALETGYAVFRWDKRGTGRSGASGRGSTTQDAVNAYEVALDQMRVNARRAVIVAQDSGTRLLGSSFGLFARSQPPYGVALLSSVLDEKDVLAIDSRLQIIVSQEDWYPWQKVARAACAAHNALYKHGASYYVAPNADRLLNDARYGTFHYGARKALHDWLLNLHPSTALV